MAVPVASALISAIRLWVLDNGTTSALTDAQYLTLLNEVYLRWFEAIEPRIAWESANTLFGTTVKLTANTASVTTVRKDVIEVLGIFLTTTKDLTLGVRLEREELNNLLGLLQAQPTAGTPQKWAALRAFAATSTDIGKWTVYFWPPADGTASTFIAGMTRCYPAVLTTSDTPDVSEAAAYTIARVAAARAARLLGRDDAFIATITDPIPSDVQQSMKIVTQAVTLPRQRPDEKPA